MNEINTFIVSQNSVPEYNWRMPDESQLCITWNGGRKTILKEVGIL
jgi:hypothetical protein